MSIIDFSSNYSLLNWPRFAFSMRSLQNICQLIKSECNKLATNDSDLHPFKVQFLPFSSFFEVLELITCA